MHMNDTSCTFYLGRWPTAGYSRVGVRCEDDQCCFVEFAALGSGSTATQIPVYMAEAGMVNITGTRFPINPVWLICGLLSG